MAEKADVKRVCAERMEEMKKPAQWKITLAWALCVGGFLYNTFVPDLPGAEIYQLSRTAARFLSYLGLSRICAWSLAKDRWEKASPEQRRDMEREDRDERQQMIRDKAAYQTWKYMDWVLLAGMAAMLVLGCRYGVIGFAAANLANSVLYALSYSRLSKEY